MAVLIVTEADGRTNHIELARVEVGPVPEIRDVRVAITGPAFDAILHLERAEAAEMARGLRAAAEAIDALARD